jgi:glycine cleavage system T protein (aminomethyltransferase)
MDNESRKTLLHDWHTAKGANMASFASYDMPLWYPAGTKTEHLAVLTGAGLFDTSHMALVLVSGKGAHGLLQECFSRDLDACVGAKKTPLVTGRCVYGVFLDRRGHVIDDAIVYRVAEEAFMVVVNAGMGGTIAAHLSDNKGEFEPAIRDLTDRVGKIDLQGPASAKVLKKIIRNPEAVFSAMPYFSFKGWFEGIGAKGERVELINGCPVLLSRTGYTGEFGFELYVDPSRTLETWEMILEAGRDQAVIPCGLAARDSLRAGAVLPLSHQDIGNWPFVHNPWLFALPWDETGKGFRKNFIGAKALMNADGDHTLAFAGYDPRKINAGDNSSVADPKGNPIGTILTCTTDMSIGRIDKTIVGIATGETSGKPADFIPRGLCCGFIKVKNPLTVGQEVILTDGKRKITVEIRCDIRPNRTALCAIGKMV